MHLQDKAFEKAYLKLIKEDEYSSNPEELGEDYLEKNIKDITDDDKEEYTADVDGECIAEAEEETKESDEQESDEQESDEQESAELEVGTDTETDSETDSETEEQPMEGKFISFFTTNQDLIDAFQNEFVSISIKPKSEDEDEDKDIEPIEFEADAFENLSVEDLQEDEGSDVKSPAEVDIDAIEADMDSAASAEDELETAEDDEDDEDDEKKKEKEIKKKK